VAIEALISAAEEDSATGGPDPKRGIYPNIVTVTADGYREIPDDEIAPIVDELLEGRP
jgi:proteasome beta subunit